MIKHLDVCTHIRNPEDRDILTRKLFDVNMRLFKTSDVYNRLVRDACAYIEWCCVTEKDGYKIPHGWSGANAGIPWNIIAYKIDDKHARIMINPVIHWKSPNVRQVKSNCGSLTLREPIEVTRSVRIDVSYYKVDGSFVIETFNIDSKAFTIQHEVEHNLGILITNKVTGVL